MVLPADQFTRQIPTQQFFTSVFYFKQRMSGTRNLSAGSNSSHKNSAPLNCTRLSSGEILRYFLIDITVTGIFIAISAVCSVTQGYLDSFPQCPAYSFWCLTQNGHNLAQIRSIKNIFTWTTVHIHPEVKLQCQFEALLSKRGSKFHRTLELSKDRQLISLLF